MKAILALCFVAVASAASVSNDIDAPVLSQVLDISPDGTYQHSFETGNGISAQASGALKTPETEAVQGTFQYTAPDGTPISVSYVADDNGYQPQGAHIPEIPAYITRALEWQRTHPEKEEPLRKL
ncbi:larval cuticle protein LCP-17 [Aethina tumida]|uniref:larval cuticle protein LCP-17 n=1 Tax=Aethina tumida TaxID=116153 RepID=UPI00096B3D3A|nr:larval cuticle protein LCP-17 [Aethina tumida]